MNDLAVYNADSLAKLLGGISGDYDYGQDREAGAQGHYSDKGKMPWHPTFSEESNYSTDKYSGGTWSKDADGKDVFVPSQDMVQAGAVRGLAEYFKRVEPNGKLIAPVPYNDTIFK